MTKDQYIDKLFAPTLELAAEVQKRFDDENARIGAYLDRCEEMETKTRDRVDARSEIVTNPCIEILWDYTEV